MRILIKFSTLCVERVPKVIFCDVSISYVRCETGETDLLFVKILLPLPSDSESLVNGTSQTYTQVFFQVQVPFIAWHSHHYSVACVFTFYASLCEKCYCSD